MSDIAYLHNRPYTKIHKKMGKEIIVLGKIKQAGFDLRKRVYNPKSICPTIYTQQGGGCEPKVIRQWQRLK